MFLFYWFMCMFIWITLPYFGSSFRGAEVDYSGVKLILTCLIVRSRVEFILPLEFLILAWSLNLELLILDLLMKHVLCCFWFRFWWVPNKRVFMTSAKSWRWLMRKRSSLPDGVCLSVLFTSSLIMTLVFFRWICG